MEGLRASHDVVHGPVQLDKNLMNDMKHSAAADAPVSNADMNNVQVQKFISMLPVWLMMTTTGFAQDSVGNAQEGERLVEAWRRQGRQFNL